MTVFSIDFLAQWVSRLLGEGRIEEANRIALEACRYFLVDAPETCRDELFHKVFTPLYKNYRTQYQPYDFEIVDYQLYRFSQSLPLIRGPRPRISALTAGQYGVILGAAQFFGRFHPVGLNGLILEHCGLDTVNLSIGGAGPGLFADTAEIIALCQSAKFVVLQVLSGRSIGCEEYPGERMTAPANKPGTPRRDRNQLLAEIWQDDRREAIRLVTKWNENYIAAYRRLIKTIGRPVILAWVSDRAPGDWSVDRLQTVANFGRFPHLVSAQMVAAIAADAHAYVEGPKDVWLPYGMKSRFTGQEVPFYVAEAAWGTTAMQNSYYQSYECVKRTFDLLKPVIDAL
jgi:hypothetical protein